MADFATCAFVVVVAGVAIGLLTALSVAATKHYRAWSRFDAMMRDHAASDPQNAARETQG